MIHSAKGFGSVYNFFFTGQCEVYPCLILAAHVWQTISKNPKSHKTIQCISCPPRSPRLIFIVKKTNNLTTLTDKKKASLNKLFKKTCSDVPNKVIGDLKLIRLITATWINLYIFLYRVNVEKYGYIHLNKIIF